MTEPIQNHTKHTDRLTKGTEDETMAMMMMTTPTMMMRTPATRHISVFTSCTGFVYNIVVHKGHGTKGK